MTKTNMDNKLGLIWRKNVNGLLDYHRMTRADLSRLIGKSASTMQANFGGTEETEHLPSMQTVNQIERSFKLPQGSLSKEGFSPSVTESQTPSEAAMAGQAEPQASINIPIPPDKLTRILRILNE